MPLLIHKPNLYSYHKYFNLVTNFPFTTITRVTIKINYYFQINFGFNFVFAYIIILPHIVIIFHLHAF